MNDHILKNAIDRLPQYSPPARLWDKIENALETDEMIAEAVQELPSYIPPAMIWKNIESGLNQAPQHRTALRLIFSSRAVMAAASLAILLSAAWWLLRPVSLPSENTVAVNIEKRINSEPAATQPENNAIPTIKAPKKPMKKWARKTGKTAGAITFSQKTVDNQLLEVCREQENAAFALVENLCREQMPVCEIPAFKMLKTELDELTVAQNDLRNALGQYADDPELVSQMVQIERERSAILQKLIQLI